VFSIFSFAKVLFALVTKVKSSKERNTGMPSISLSKEQSQKHIQLRLTIDKNAKTPPQHSQTKTIQRENVVEFGAYKYMLCVKKTKVLFSQMYAYKKFKGLSLGLDFQFFGIWALSSDLSINFDFFLIFKMNTQIHIQKLTNDFLYFTYVVIFSLNLFTHSMSPLVRYIPFVFVSVS